MKKYFVFIIFILSIFVSFFASEHIAFATGNNSGFIDTSIWYSPNDFSEGDTIQIHTAVWNGEDYSINAKVEFLDVNTILGSRDVTIAKNTLQDVSISWKVTAGNHKISTRISQAQSVINGVKSNITIINKEEAAKDFSVAKKLAINKDGETEIIPTITNKVNEVLPQSMAVPVVKTVGNIDSFRQDINGTLSDFKSDTVERLELLNNPKPVAKTDSKSNTVEAQEKPKPMSGIDKPVAYVELFLLTVALFIFHNSIVFYSLLAFLLFIILRFLYRKMRR